MLLPELADAAYSATISGYVLTVAQALICAGIGWLLRAVARLERVSQVLVREVMPEGDSSIRERMREVEKDLAVTRALAGLNRSPIIVNTPPAPPDTRTGGP